MHSVLNNFFLFKSSKYLNLQGSNFIKTNLRAPNKVCNVSSPFVSSKCVDAPIAFDSRSEVTIIHLDDCKKICDSQEMILP